MWVSNLTEAQLKNPERKASDTESLAMKLFQFILKFELEIPSKVDYVCYTKSICVAFTASNVIFAVVCGIKAVYPRVHRIKHSYVAAS